MIGYFVFFVFLIIFVYVSVRWGTFLISDLISGFILLLFLTYFCYGRNTDRGLILIFMVNLFFYALLFFSSIFIYFDKENEKKTYYIFPILTSILLMIVQKETVNYDEAFWGIYTPVAGAFFPLYFLKYYMKYIKEEF